jgi:hypothetical protein
MDGTRKYAWSSGLPQGSPDFFCAPALVSLRISGVLIHRFANR